MREDTRVTAGADRDAGVEGLLHQLTAALLVVADGEGGAEEGAVLLHERHDLGRDVVAVLDGADAGNDRALDAFTRARVRDDLSSGAVRDVDHDLQFFERERWL